MNLRYRYFKAGKSFEGSISIELGAYGNHSVVRTVLQNIANAENEVIAIDMFSAKNQNIAIGKDAFCPESGDKNSRKTITAVELSEDGILWKMVSIAD